MSGALIMGGSSCHVLEKVVYSLKYRITDCHDANIFQH